MTNSVLREKFNSQFRYEDIGEKEIDLLIDLVKEELDHYGNTDIGSRIKMTLSSVRKRDKKFKNGSVIKYFLMVDGSYFKRREAISFNQGGFIGFAGWADKHNVQPFLNAFSKWITLLEQNKQSI